MANWRNRCTCCNNEVSVILLHHLKIGANDPLSPALDQLSTQQIQHYQQVTIY